MNRLSSRFRRLVAYTVGGVAVLAFALLLRALFATQSQPITANVLAGDGSLGTTFFTEDDDQLQPAWSPDGRYLAYLTVQADGLHLFRRDLLTNEVIQIADHALNPIWSPDGARLAYERPVGNELDLYVTDAGGIEHVKVNDVPNPIGVQWLPDSQSLLFSVRMDEAELHIVASDGSGGRVVIVPDVWALSVSDVSPDGRQAIGNGIGIESQTPTGLLNIDLQTGEFAPLLPFDDLAAGNGLWSPDGQYVAYYTPDPNPSLGSTLRVTRLADGESHTFFAANLAQYAWSPDSRFIAYNSSTGFQGNELIIGWADGSQQVRISGLTLNSFAWSPDGSQIAVSVRNGDQSDIAIIRADEASLLAYLDALQATPTPLPFPTPLATPTPLQDFDFYWPTRLTDDPTGNYRPAVSPDGLRIAFASERDGNWDIYLLDRASGAETRLTDDPLNDMAPSWSPDGSRIAYQHNVPDPSGPVRVEHVVMNMDGSGKTVVSSGAVWNGNEAPAWSPFGDRIAFSDGKGVTVVGVTDQRRVAFTPSDTSAYFSPAWIDDHQLAFVHDGQLSIGDTTSGAVTPVPGESGFARLPLTTRASSHIAYFALDDGARLITTLPDGGGIAVLAQLYGSNIQHAAWSPDGRFIAYYIDDSIQVSIAWTNQYETDAPLFTILNVTAGLSDLVGVAWLPDSSGFVYVAENEGQPDLYLATLNQPAIQAYVDYFPIYAATQIAPPMPTTPPPPTMFPLPTPFGGSPTPLAVPTLAPTATTTPIP